MRLQRHILALCEFFLLQDHLDSDVVSHLLQVCHLSPLLDACLGGPGVRVSYSIVEFLCLFKNLVDLLASDPEPVEALADLTLSLDLAHSVGFVALEHLLLLLVQDWLWCLRFDDSITLLAVLGDLVTVVVGDFAYLVCGLERLAWAEAHIVQNVAHEGTPSTFNVVLIT